MSDDRSDGGGHQPPEERPRRGHEQPPDPYAAPLLRIHWEELRRTAEELGEDSRSLREQAMALVRASRELRTAIAAARSRPPSSRAWPLPPREPLEVEPP